MMQNPYDDGLLRSIRVISKGSTYVTDAATNRKYVSSKMLIRGNGWATIHIGIIDDTDITHYNDMESNHSFPANLLQIKTGR